MWGGWGWGGVRGGRRGGGVDRDGVRTWIVVSFLTASIAATASVINCIHASSAAMETVRRSVIRGNGSC